MPYNIVINQQQHQCIRRQGQATQQLKRRPVLMRTDMMTGKFIDPFEVERGHLTELIWANKNTNHELAKDCSARDGPHVLAKCKCGEVQCRLSVTQQTTDERLDAKQSTPPSIVARRLWTITFLTACDEIEDHDWVVRQLYRAMDGVRAAVRA